MIPTLELRFVERLNRIRILQQWHDYDEEEKSWQMEFHGKCGCGEWVDVPVEKEYPRRAQL